MSSASLAFPSNSISIEGISLNIDSKSIFDRPVSASNSFSSHPMDKCLSYWSLLDLFHKNEIFTLLNWADFSEGRIRKQIEHILHESLLEIHWDSFNLFVRTDPCIRFIVKCTCQRLVGHKYLFCNCNTVAHIVRDFLQFSGTPAIRVIASRPCRRSALDFQFNWTYFLKSTIGLCYTRKIIRAIDIIPTNLPFS